MIKELREAARGMTMQEATMKLAIVMVFLPFPILGLTFLGLWIDYYKLNTTPLFLGLGALLGSIISFLGVCKIVTWGH